MAREIKSSLFAILTSRLMHANLICSHTLSEQFAVSHLLVLTINQSVIKPRSIGGRLELQSTRETKNQFHYVFIKFIRVICSVAYPTVFAFEDMQCIYADSLSLFFMLMMKKLGKGLMCVCNYRDNEVNDNNLVSNLTNVI